MRNISLHIIGIIAMALISCSAENRDTTLGDDKGTDTSTPTMEFNADSAYNHIARQVAMGPRVPGSDAHRQCGQYIATTLRAAGADTVIMQQGTVTRHDGVKLPIVNILGRYNGSAQRRVLIAAHYDTRPWADEDPDASKHKTPLPGANDGGSGVGVILELARLIGEKSPEIGVDLLLVDAEDSGISGDGDLTDSWCLGTQYWAENLPYGEGVAKPEYGIVLDMVGGQNAVFHRESVSEYLAPAVNNKVWGTALKSPYASRFNNSIYGSLVDDHLYINRAGIPCIDIVECANPVTGSFPPTWHTMADNMAAIDRSTLKAVGQVVTDVIYAEKCEK